MLRGALVAAALFVLTAPLAPAHVDPPGCVGNVFMPRSIGGVESVKRNGDVLTLTAKVGNNASGACNVTAATVRLAVPNPDGSFGTPTIVATGVNLPAGAAVTQRGPALKRTVAFDTGVFRGFVQLNLTGTQHSQPDPDVESDLGLGMARGRRRRRHQEQGQPDQASHSGRVYLGWIGSRSGACSQ